MRLTWEKYRPSDLEAMLGLMKDFAAAASLPWNRGQREKNIAEFTDSPGRGELWMVCADGKKIGYAVVVSGFSFELVGRLAFVDELHIDAQFQGKGAGTRTLDFIARDAAGRGAKVVLLEASDSESRLHSFYEKAGFSRRGYRLYFKTLEGRDAA